MKTEIKTYGKEKASEWFQTQKNHTHVYFGNSKDREIQEGMPVEFPSLLKNEEYKKDKEKKCLIIYRKVQPTFGHEKAILAEIGIVYSEFSGRVFSDENDEKDNQLVEYFDTSEAARVWVEEKMKEAQRWHEQRYEEQKQTQNFCDSFVITFF